MVWRKKIAKNLRNIREIFAKYSQNIHEKFVKILQKNRKKFAKKQNSRKIREKFANFRKFCANFDFSQIFCDFFAKFLRIFRKYFANISQIFREDFANFSRIFCARPREESVSFYVFTKKSPGCPG